ncbi:MULTISPECIES: hypothetical protein [Spirulina sp. CCY15215]|uniref:hypothetical protein n=1 Tax=Spirulina sp. CCY15215 TaxID=2767591 RepID=UPI00194F1158|nr:hypothetical protein [Spirulina major]
MKFSADRQEKKGPFGGAYYETEIKVTLTDKELETARRQNIMRAILVGGDMEGEGKEIFLLCGKQRVSMNDLMIGITAKVGNGSKLGTLANFEDQLREACKGFKANLEADQFFAGGGSKSEEEF